ncbi:hypothetical protein ACFL6Y_10685, partial [Elusimicrobiota bacterium]
MDKKAYKAVLEPFIETITQTNKYSALHSQTGWQGLINDRTQRIALLRHDAKALRARGNLAEADRAEHEASKLHFLNTSHSIVQTTGELAVISFPIAKGAAWLGTRLARGAVLAGAGPQAAVYAAKAPHVGLAVGMGVPLVTHTIHSARVALALRKRHKEKPDAVVPQETSTMIAETNNVVSLVTALVGLSIAGRYIANRARAGQEAIEAKNIKEAMEATREVSKIEPKDITPEAINEAYKKLESIEVSESSVKEKRTPLNEEIREMDSRIRENDKRAEITPRPGQFDTTQTLARGESAHAQTAAGKSLSGIVYQSVAKQAGKAKLSEGQAPPATEYITPDSTNARQILKDGGIGEVKYSRIAKELGLEFVDGDALFNQYKQGNKGPLLEAYRQGKDLVFSKESYGHLTNTINSDLVLRKTVKKSVGSVLADELHGVMTERTNYIVGDGITGGIRKLKANKLVSKYTRLWKDIEAVKPKEVVSPKELLNTSEPAISIDPVSGRVLKNKALEKALSKKGYEGAEIDDMLTARYTPEARKSWAVDTEGTSSPDLRSPSPSGRGQGMDMAKGDPASSPSPSGRGHGVRDTAKIYPRGENGIMRDSIFSSKALEVGAYLREGIKPKGKVKINSTFASATLLEAFSIRSNAQIVGMSGSLLAVLEMIKAGIGTKVTTIDTKGASGTREAPEYSKIKSDSTHHVDGMGADIIRALKNKRGALVFDLDYAKAVKEYIKRHSPDTKIYEITDVASESMILEIAKKAGKENAVVITNKRGIQGIDYKGNIDIFANIDHLNAFELTQVMGRGARTKGTISRSHIYHTAKTTSKIAQLLGEGKSGILTDALVEKLSKSPNKSTQSALKSWRAQRTLTPGETVSLGTELSLAINKSNSSIKLITEVFRSKRVLEPIKKWARTVKSRRAKNILNEMMKKVLNGETKVGEKALEEIAYEDPLKVPEKAFKNARTEANAVFELLKENLKDLRGTQDILVEMKDILNEMNSIKDADFSSIAKAQEASFMGAASVTELIAVAKRLAGETILPQLKRGASKSIQHTVNSIRAEGEGSSVSSSRMGGSTSFLSSLEDMFQGARQRITSLIGFKGKKNPVSEEGGDLNEILKQVQDDRKGIVQDDRGVQDASGGSLLSAASNLLKRLSPSKKLIIAAPLIAGGLIAASQMVAAPGTEGLGLAAIPMLGVIKKNPFGSIASFMKGLRDRFVNKDWGQIIDNDDGTFVFLMKDKSAFRVSPHDEAMAQYDSIERLVYNADGKQIFIAVKGKKKMVVFNGVEGPEFDGIRFFNIGPDGQPVYVGVNGEECRMVNGEDIGSPYDAIINPVFSPDNRLAYEVRKGKKWGAVFDGTEEPLFDRVSYLGFDKESRLGYVAQMGEKDFIMYDGEKQTPMSDGQRIADFDDIHYFQFSPDNEMVYEGRRKYAKSYIVINNNVTAEHDSINYVKFTSDNKLVYLAREKGLTFLMHDGEPGADKFTWARILVTGPDGQVAYAAGTGETNPKRVILNGKEEPVYGDVSTLGFSPNGTLIYKAANSTFNSPRANGPAHKESIVFGEEKGPDFDEVKNMYFDNGGKPDFASFNNEGKLVYAGREGRDYFIMFGEEKGPVLEKFRDLAITPEGEVVVLGSVKGKYGAWDVTSIPKEEVEDLFARATEGLNRVPKKDSRIRRKGRVKFDQLARYFLPAALIAVGLFSLVYGYHFAVLGLPFLGLINSQKAFVVKDSPNKLIYISRGKTGWEMGHLGKKEKANKDISDVSVPPGTIYSKTAPGGKNIAHIVNVDGGVRVYFKGEYGPKMQNIENILSEPLVFSQDGERLAYLADNGKYNRFVVVDGEPQPAHRNVAGVVFSHDGKHVAYVAQRMEWRLDEHLGKLGYLKLFVVRDGMPGQEYEDLLPESLAFSNDGKQLAFIADEGMEGEHHIFINGKKMDGSKGAVGGIAFNSDGEQIAYVKTEGVWEYIVKDGTRISHDHAGEKYGISALKDRIGRNDDQKSRRISRIAFTHDNEHLVYVLEENKKQHVMFDGEYGPEFKEINDLFLDAEGNVIVKGKFHRAKGIWKIALMSAGETAKYLKDQNDQLNRVPRVDKSNSRRRKSSVRFDLRWIKDLIAPAIVLLVSAGVVSFLAPELSTSDFGFLSSLGLGLPGSPEILPGFLALGAMLPLSKRSRFAVQDADGNEIYITPNGRAWRIEDTINLGSSKDDQSSSLIKNNGNGLSSFSLPLSGSDYPLVSPDGKRAARIEDRSYAKKIKKKRRTLAGIIGKWILGLIFIQDKSAKRPAKTEEIIKKERVITGDWHGPVSRKWIIKPDDPSAEFLDNVQEGPEYEGVLFNSLRFTPDGKHLAYIAYDKGRYFVVIDGEVKELPDGDYDAVGYFALSPDGKRYALWARKLPRVHDLIVDGKVDRTVDHPPGFLFSPNSEHVAYIITQRETYRNAIVLDGVAGEWHDSVSMTFDHKSQLVYAFTEAKHVLNTKGHEEEVKEIFIVKDGKVTKAPSGVSEIGRIVLSDDGKHMAYNAGHFVVFDDEFSAPLMSVDNIVLSPGGKRMAYWGHKEPGKQVLIVDRHEGPEFWRVSDVTFSQDGKHLVYVGKYPVQEDGDERREHSVVIDNKIELDMDEVSHAYFNEDGTLAVSGVRDGTEFRWILKHLSKKELSDVLEGINTRLAKVPQKAKIRAARRSKVKFTAASAASWIKK